MDNNTINPQGKRYVFSTEELIDVVKKNFDEIINIFKNFYNESLNDQNIYTKFIIELEINGETKRYDLDSLAECKNTIENNSISDFRIYVCSCAKSTENHYLFSSLDAKIEKNFAIRVNYFDEFNHTILKKYEDSIKQLLNDYCICISCYRNDEYIKDNQSDDYEVALSNYQRKFKEDCEKIDINELLNKIDKKIEELDKMEKEQKQSSNDFQNNDSRTISISGNGKYEYTLLGKTYEFTVTVINDNEAKIDVSDYGLAQKRENGSISLLDKENRFLIKKGERIVLRTQTMDYGEEVTLKWN